MEVLWSEGKVKLRPKTHLSFSVETQIEEGKNGTVVPPLLPGRKRLLCVPSH